MYAQKFFKSMAKSSPPLPVQWGHTSGPLSREADVHASLSALLQVPYSRTHGRHSQSHIHQWVASRPRHQKWICELQPFLEPPNGKIFVMPNIFLAQPLEQNNQALEKHCAIVKDLKLSHFGSCLVAFSSCCKLCPFSEDQCGSVIHICTVGLS